MSLQPRHGPKRAKSLPQACRTTPTSVRPGSRRHALTVAKLGTKHCVRRRDEVARRQRPSARPQGTRRRVNHGHGMRLPSSTSLEVPGVSLVRARQSRRSWNMSGAACQMCTKGIATGCAPVHSPGAASQGCLSPEAACLPHTRSYERS